MIILSHPTGNFNVRMTAKVLYDCDLLEEFNTCISLPKYNPIINSLGGRIKDEYFRRVFSEIPESKQFSYPYREILRQVYARTGFFQRLNQESHPLSIFSVYKSFDHSVACRIKKGTTAGAVYSYEDGARETFVNAKKQGLKRIYELPIGYWKSARNIFEEEREINPQWANTLAGLNDSNEKLRRKDEELELADSIVVASEFVKSTLINHSKSNKDIFVIPYCSPSKLILKEPFYHKGKLRVLYVGSLTQRKGLSYAIDAVDALKDRVTFTMIGHKVTSECKPLNKALDQHSWIQTLPHDQILCQMRNHDVLLFPTLFDGFGLVITEALSQGIPIITTINSGGPECIRDGLEGFLVPIRDTYAIIKCLDKLDKDRAQLRFMKEACLQRSKYLSYQLYQQQLVKALNTITI